MMISKKPFFSVCIPVYNGADFLKECLESILNQSFRDFEVIVVDDKSADGSVGIVRSYAAIDDRVKAFENEVNLGLVGNWNRCLSLASGEWIKFLFQDDFWNRDCLERIHEVSDGQVFIFHNRNFVFNEGVSDSLVKFYQSPFLQNFFGDIKTGFIPADTVNAHILRKIGFNFFGEPSNVAFRRNLALEYGYFDDRLVQLCDYEYWVRIASNTGAFYVADKISSFTVHSGGTSSINRHARVFRAKYLDLLIICDKFLNDTFFLKLKSSDKRGTIEAALKVHVNKMVLWLSRNSDKSLETSHDLIKQYVPRVCDMVQRRYRFRHIYGLYYGLKKAIYG
jgi:glycosyltransferase involved in cell wall biosynthesis